MEISTVKKSVKWQRVPCRGICTPWVLLVSLNMSESWRCATSGENLLQPLAASTNLALFHPSFFSSLQTNLLFYSPFLIHSLYFSSVPLLCLYTPQGHKGIVCSLSLCPSTLLIITQYQASSRESTSETLRHKPNCVTPQVTADTPFLTPLLSLSPSLTHTDAHMHTGAEEKCITLIRIAPGFVFQLCKHTILAFSLTCDIFLSVFWGSLVSIWHSCRVAKGKNDCTNYNESFSYSEQSESLKTSLLTSSRRI